MSTELIPPRESSPTIDSSPSSSSPLASTQAANSKIHSAGHSAAKDRPLADIISERFAPFDHSTHIVGPFDSETTRDLSFEQDLSEMLLDVILETHAWAATRPKHERHSEVQKLENKISEVMETEKEQEKTREKLSNFVQHMKTALAALTSQIL